MTEAQFPELITYVDCSEAEWQEFRPGSRRKILYENLETGQLKPQDRRGNRADDPAADPRPRRQGD